MSKDGFETIAFRVRNSDYRVFQRISKQLFNSGRLKEPRTSVLSKTFLYVMANQYLMLEAQAESVLNQITKRSPSS
jgi:hypothetical protein